MNTPSGSAQFSIAQHMEGTIPIIGKDDNWRIKRSARNPWPYSKACQTTLEMLQTLTMEGLSVIRHGQKEVFEVSSVKLFEYQKLSADRAKAA